MNLFILLDAFLSPETQVWEKALGFWRSLKSAAHNPTVVYFSPLPTKNNASLQALFQEFEFEQLVTLIGHDALLQSYSKNHFLRTPMIEPTWEGVFSSLNGVVERLKSLSGEEESLLFEDPEALKARIDRGFHEMPPKDSDVSSGTMIQLSLLLRTNLLLEIRKILFSGNVQEALSMFEASFCHLQGEHPLEIDGELGYFLRTLQVHGSEIDAGLVSSHPFGSGILRLIEQHKAEIQAQMNLPAKCNVLPLTLIVVKTPKESLSLMNGMKDGICVNLEPRLIGDLMNDISPRYILAEEEILLRLRNDFPWRLCSLVVDTTDSEGFIQFLFDQEFGDASVTMFIKMNNWGHGRLDDCSLRWITSVRQSAPLRVQHGPAHIIDQRVILSWEKSNDFDLSEPRFIASQPSVPQRSVGKLRPSPMLIFVDTQFAAEYPTFCALLTASQMTLIPRRILSGCDIIIDEQTCAKVVLWREFQDESTLISLQEEVFLLPANYTKCFFLILAKELRNNQDPLSFPATRFLACLQALQNQNLSVVVRRFERDEDLSSYICEICEFSEKEGTSNREWIRLHESKHEQFLSSFFGFDPLKAQV